MVKIEGIYGYFVIVQAKAENMKEGFLLSLEILYLSVS